MIPCSTWMIPFSKVSMVTKWDDHPMVAFQYLVNNHIVMQLLSIFSHGSYSYCGVIIRRWLWTTLYILLGLYKHVDMFRKTMMILAPFSAVHTLLGWINSCMVFRCSISIFEIRLHTGCLKDKTDCANKVQKIRMKVQELFNCATGAGVVSTGFCGQILDEDEKADFRKNVLAKSDFSNIISFVKRSMIAITMLKPSILFFVKHHQSSPDDQLLTIALVQSLSLHEHSQHQSRANNDRSPWLQINHWRKPSILHQIMDRNWTVPFSRQLCSYRHGGGDFHPCTDEWLIYGACYSL